MINFVSDWRQVGGFLWVLWFHSTNKKWLPWYNWNIVESGVKHHKSNPTIWPRRPLRYSIYILPPNKFSKWYPMWVPLSSYSSGL
jgi:hypothetical protein